MMQYIKNYVRLISFIKETLEVKRQAYVLKDRLTDEQAAIVAQDLNLSCLYNKTLQRYYFRKMQYNQMQANETLIH